MHFILQKKSTEPPTPNQMIKPVTRTIPPYLNFIKLLEMDTNSHSANSITPISKDTIIQKHRMHNYTISMFVSKREIRYLDVWDYPNLNSHNVQFVNVKYAPRNTAPNELKKKNVLNEHSLKFSMANSRKHTHREYESKRHCNARYIK